MTSPARSGPAPAVAFLLLALAVLSPVPRGQQVLPAQGIPVAGAPPTPLSSARFSASAVGEFTGDLDLDVLVLDEGVPTLLVSPETMRTSLLASRDGYDLATLPDGAGPGHDVALLVGPDGLHALSYDLDELQWEDVAVETSAAWRHAFAVAVGQLDGSGGLDVAALAAGGTSVLVLHASGSGFVAGTALALPSAAHDLLMLDWDDDGSDEIAVLFLPDPPPGGASGVRVYDGGTSIYAASSPSLLRGAVLRDGESGAERLALAGRVNGVDYLKVHGALLSQPLQNFGSVSLRRLQGWDLDADGDDDLALTADSGTEILRLPYLSPSQRDPGDPILDVLSGVLLPYGDPDRDPAWSEADLATGDFDRDGHGDLFAPVQGNWTGTTGDVYSDIVLVSGDPAARAQGQVAVFSARVIGSVSSSPLVLELGLTPPGKLQAASGQTVELEVTAWAADGLWGPTQQDAAEPRTRVPLPLPLPASTYDVPIHLAAVTGNEILSVVLREVLVDAGTVVAAGPSTTVLHAGEGIWQAIQAFPSAEQTITTLVYETKNSVGGQPGGGVVIGPSLPRFGANTAPRWE